MLKRAFMPVLVGALILGGLAGCKNKGGDSSTATGDIVIGEYMPLTGSTATFGNSSHQGTLMAVDEINAAGGVHGRKLKLVTEDDQGKPDVARAAVTKLITQSKAVALIGEIASTRSMAAAPVCDSHKTPMITPCSTNPRVTQMGPFIFRVCFTDDFQAAVVGRFAYDQGYRNAAVFYDMKSDYSEAFAQNFEKEFSRLGGKIAAKQQFQEGDPEFKPQLNALKAAKPDCLLIPGYYSEVGTIARQAREIGLNVPLLGGDGWDSPKLVPSAGTAVENCFFSNHFSPSDTKSPVSKAFVESYTKRFGVKPDALAALGYDAAKLLADALNRSNGAGGDALRTAIGSTKGFPGVTGDITLDTNRNARKAAILLQVKGTEFRIFKKYTPDQLGL